MRTRLLIATVALVATGCGAQPLDVTDQPPDAGSAGEFRWSFDGELLSGIPDCRLAEAVDSDDALAPEDEALGEHVVAAIGPSAERGPLVAVDEAGDSERTFVGARFLDPPDGESEVALWIIEASDPPGAVNDLAASVSGLALISMDDPTADGSALAYDCAHVVADRLYPRPDDPPPTMRPDLLVLEPDRAAPGEIVEMRFPEETMRGIAFHLDRRVGDEWQTTHWLTSDGAGGEPSWVHVGTEGVGWPDIGVMGPGPDRIEVPADAPAGEHRVCTANAGENFCVPLEILEE